MFTTLTTSVAAEHRNDLIRAAQERRAWLVADDALPRQHRRTARRSRHSSGPLVSVRAWFAASQL